MSKSQCKCPRSHNCADWEMDTKNMPGTSTLYAVHVYQVSFQSVETMEVVHSKNFHTQQPCRDSNIPPFQTLFSGFGL